jgi:hypothetical protein
MGRTIFKAMPPSMGQRAEPLSIDRIIFKAKPPSMGRKFFKAKPPSMGRTIFKVKPPSMGRTMIWGDILYCLAPKAQWLSMVCCQHLITERKNGGRKYIDSKDRIDAAARRSMGF